MHTVFCAVLESKNSGNWLFLPAFEYAQYTCELNIKNNKTLSITQYHVAESDDDVTVQTFFYPKTIIQIDYTEDPAGGSTTAVPPVG